MRQTLPRPKRQPETWLHIEERHGAELELPSDDSFGMKAQAFSIEPHRALEVIHSERDHRNASFHGAAAR